MRRVYGVRMVEVWRGDVTIRECAALAAYLPAGSQVWVTTDHDLAWTTQNYLTAVSVDRQRTDKDQKPVPRPSDARERAAYVQAAQDKADRAIAKQQH